MAVALALSGLTVGLAAPEAQVWNYALLEGGMLQDECLICGRPPIRVPLRGTFQLRLVDQNPLWRTYALDNISFAGGAPPGAQYKVAGQGTYTVSGEVALMQQMFLEVWIDDGRTNQLCYFTNDVPSVDRPWPMLNATLNQTNGPLIQTFTLWLPAAPLREIWFSTGVGILAGIWQPPTNFVSPGDLLGAFIGLAPTGRVVRMNGELTGHLGIMPVAPDLGLAAVDVLPGGEIAFASGQDVFSESLGELWHGDLLSDRGRIVKRNQDLTQAFLILPPVPDVGLDGVQVLDSGEIYFSIQTDITTGTGAVLHHGDLLSDAGRVVKSNQELLARFHPAKTNYDYGLDAFYVWPSGEVWFSTKEGFSDQLLVFVQDGDLLSDQGYVVYRSVELVSGFEPQAFLANYGLDALFVVSDAVPLPSLAAASPTRFVEISPHRDTGNVTLQWQGYGRVFQVERAANPAGPYFPLSPLLPDVQFEDAGALNLLPQACYRLRQW
jgi:hypothetical protein